MFKVEGKSKNIRDRKYISLFQKSPNGFAVRYFAVIRKYKDLKTPEFNIFEVNRDFYEDNKCESYIFDKFKQTDEIRWCDNNYNFGNYSTVYEKNLAEILADTRYKYSALKEFAVRFDGANVYVHGYLEKYTEYPCMEYLTKLKLYNLVSNLSSSCYHSLPKNAVNLEETLGVEKQHIKILQDLNVDFGELTLVKKFIELNLPFTADYFRSVVKTFGNNSKTAIEYLKYASLEKIERYCTKYIDKFNNFSHVFILWKDYINSCEKLGYDLTNDFVMFPKNLQKSHDLAYKRVDKLRKAGRKKMLDSMTKRLPAYFAEIRKNYGFEDDEYAVIVPSTLNDIVNEGHVLRHCVGGYAERIAEKRTIILFLRLKSDINTPFYTIEISQNRIVQCRGKMNCDMTDSVKSFAESFEKAVLSAKNHQIQAG
jgi:hypothetical protein